MATKKLTAELEVETSKARQKVREIAETGGGAAAGGDVAADTERASRALKNFGNEAEHASVNMRSAVKAFAGMGIGLAASYAQAQMEPGSVGQRAVGYLGSAASGAMMGAVAGPWGAVAGAGVGIMKEGFNQSAQDKAAEKAKEETLRSIETWERARAQTLAFKELLEGLTKEEGSLADRMAAVTAEIEKRKEIDANLAETQRLGVKNGRDDLLAEATRRRQANASELDALNALMTHMGKQKGGGGTDWKGVDSLDAVGGRFAGGGTWALPDLAKDFASPAQDGPADVADGMESLAAESGEVKCLEELGDKMDKQVDLLKKIVQKEDGGGVLTWQ